MDLYPSRKPAREERAAKPSFVRRTWRRARFVAGGPVASIGIKEISNGARLIEGLFAVLRAGPQPDSRTKTNEDGSIDLRATAFSYGLAVEELHRRLREKRVQTCRASGVRPCGWTDWAI